MRLLWLCRCSPLCSPLPHALPSNLPVSSPPRYSPQFTRRAAMPREALPAVGSAATRSVDASWERQRMKSSGEMLSGAPDCARNKAGAGRKGAASHDIALVQMRRDPIVNGFGTQGDAPYPSSIRDLGITVAALACAVNAETACGKKESPASQWVDAAVQSDKENLISTRSTGDVHSLTQRAGKRKPPGSPQC